MAGPVLISDPARARALARAIVADIHLYNADKVKAGIKNDNLLKLLEPELTEGRELFKTRVSPELLEKYDFFDQAIAEVLFKSTGNLSAAVVQATYNYNGRTYHRLEEMPPEVRALFADKEGDGLPDILSGKILSARSSQTTYNYNGRTYQSLEELPAEARALFEDKDGDGVPDIFQGQGSGIKVKVNQTFKFGKTISQPDSAAAPSAPPLTDSARELAKAVKAVEARQRDFESGYNKQERPGRSGFFSRLFGKK